MRTKKAFTMVELVVVLVVIAIIATVSMPRLKRDTRNEAINHMLTMIRYTQNLALHDSKHNRANSEWQKAFWRFQIYNCRLGSGLYYAIGTDTNYNGSIDQNEAAIDPANGKLIYWAGSQNCSKNSSSSLYNRVSPYIFITQKYGINSVNFRGCRLSRFGNNFNNTAKYIGFDSFGRPHGRFGSSTTPNHFGYAVTDCRITFNFVDSNINPFTIVIPSESGYAYLQTNSNL